MTGRIACVFLLFGVVLTLAACQAPVRPAGDGLETWAVTEPVPEQPPAGKQYRVVPTASDVRVVIYPDGRLGHPHVFSGDALSGAVVIPSSAGEARDHHGIWLDLALKVSALAVDEPGWRLDEGFDPDMSERARTGTLENMRSDAVLHENEYPEVRIRAAEAVGPHWQPDLTIQVTLRGETRVLTVPVAVREQEGGALEVTGRFRIRQSDFGIEPFTALGGTVRVADEVLIRFRAHAEPDVRHSE